MSAWRAMFSRKWVFATLFVLTGAVVCARLGIWQLDRLTQRRLFNAHYSEIVQESTLILDASQTLDLTTMDYRSVIVKGIYDPTKSVALRNQYHDNQPGYFLLTPLVLADGSAILIERGWIPSEGNSTPADWRKYDQPGEVTIKGIIRVGEAQPEVGGVPDPELIPGQTHLDFWNIVNVVRISQQVPYKLPPVFIQPDLAPDLSVPPFPYQPVVEISEGPHMGYALQWFTFGSILVFGYPFFLKKQLASRYISEISEENK